MKSIPIRTIQSTQIEPDPSKSFSIKKVGGLQEYQDRIQELHRHDFFYLLSLEKGDGTHSIDFKEYKVTDNSIYFMRPGQVHEHTLNAGSTGFLMAFQPGFYPYLKDPEHKKGLRQASQTNYYKFSIDDFHFLKSILVNIFIEFEKQTKHYEEVIRSFLNILFTSINRIGNSEKLGTGYSLFSKRLEVLFELIEKDISIAKKVSYYANKMNLSIYQLNTVTQKLLGKNASELIAKYIVLESKRRLLTTDDKIKEVAFQLGFEDASYFIRFFKKHTGTTPNVFRNNFK